MGIEIAANGLSADATSKQPARTTLWFPTALILFYWTLVVALALFRLPQSVRLIKVFFGSSALPVLFCGWWLLSARATLKNRLLVLMIGAVISVVAVNVSHPSFTLEQLQRSALPLVFTVWIVWLWVSWNFSQRVRAWATAGAFVVGWLPSVLLRVDGLSGDVEPVTQWRWMPSAEELFMAEHAGGTTALHAASKEAPRRSIKLQPGDWPEFRGANRDGVVHGTHITTDWNAQPPKQLWRQRAGASWSSLAIVDGRLFTQEQRGDAETVVCLDASTGREIWVHEDKARYSDDQSGAGPRASCSFADGKIVSMGASGILNCLDANTGAVLWSRSLGTPESLKALEWGYSSSPLIAGGVAVAFAGGDGETSLQAFKMDTGAPAWKVPAGKKAFASPQMAVLDTVPQMLFLSDRGLISVLPESGKILWEFVSPVTGIWPRSTQAQAFDGSKIVFSSEADGTIVLDVAHTGVTWTPSIQVRSREFKPTFNDSVIHDGALYGYHGGVFACADLATGKRLWKGGNYGHGQVLLLADQALLLVLTEQGDAVLVEANRSKAVELGRFQAIKGKTWNHPVVAHGRLYVRNSEEMAGYELEGR